MCPARVARPHDHLTVFLEGRERVLGRRITLSVDAGIAAEQLAEFLGGRRAALAWLAELEEALR
jgi:hypothetical protein